MKKKCRQNNSKLLEEPGLDIAKVFALPSSNHEITIIFEKQPFPTSYRFAPAHSEL